MKLETEDQKKMSCSRCKRVLKLKANASQYLDKDVKDFGHCFDQYNPNKKLCTHCYHIQYDQVACVECFRTIDRLVHESSTLPVLCDVCRASRDATSQSMSRNHQPFCSRTWFNCSQCAYVHSQWCSLSHVMDLNARPKPSPPLHRSSKSIDGLYSWNRLLFCSTSCVRKTFATSNWCVLCFKHNTTIQRCGQCAIPLCSSCASYWFTNTYCPQCFADRHPDWTLQHLQIILPMQCRELHEFHPALRLLIMTFLK